MKSLDLESYWSWLPTFRVVAEHENLQEASRLLRLSASSISRTIRLLESELGQQLFTRDGGRLQLNTAGRTFLESVRKSMRLVDDGAAAVRGGEAASPFRMSLPRSLVALLAVPAMGELRKEEASLRFHLGHEGDARSVASGSMDLVVVGETRVSSAGVEAHRLGCLEVGLYCGRGHASWGLPLSEEGPSSFVSSHSDTQHNLGWSPYHTGQPSIDVADMVVAMDVCAAGLGLAILPVAMAETRSREEVLHRLEAPTLSPITLYALRRPLLVTDRAQRMLEALRRAVGLLGSPP